MRNPVNNQPVVLPSRMSLVPSAFSNMEIAVLDFPYARAFTEFTDRLAVILGKKRLDWWEYPPYRLLNSAFVACAPTIVHGFEPYKNWNSSVRRALAVGKVERDISGVVVSSTLECPSEEQIATLIRLWTQIWSKQKVLQKHIDGEAKSAWQDLQKALSEPPQTQWRNIGAEALVADLYAENGLAFNAIPSLLATLLHGEKSIIGDQGREVRWRRAQDGPNRLCVVSDPQDITFLRESRFTQKASKGFFAYKLEFQVQTQAGRQEPWIHSFLRCQRYAHEALTGNSRGTDVTVMVGMNKPRISGWTTDSTLVRLKANGMVFAGKYALPEWKDKLALLLAEFGARPLSEPGDVYANPRSFWHAEGMDEYYVLHTEGFKYNRSNHSVMTGFGLSERSEVIGRTCCEALAEVLKPDTYFFPDIACFSKNMLPQALWNIGDLLKRPPLMEKKAAEKLGWSELEREAHRNEEDRNRRAHYQSAPIDALKRAIHGSQLIIALIYRKNETRDALFQQIRQAFLLNEGDPLPSNITVLDRPILEEYLCAPLDPGHLNPATRYLHPAEQPSGFLNEWDDQMGKARADRLQSWRALLQETFSDFSPEACLAALVELPEEPKQRGNSLKTFHESQSIKGIIREACVRSNVLSQMLHPVEWKTDLENAARVLPDAEKGRVQNAVQEIVTRQIGALYGVPSEAYSSLGISDSLAPQLDIVAFCIRSTQSGINYALAVRLRATGQMDVLLPGESSKWQPYSEAGPSVGKIFARARKDIVGGNVKDGSPIRLSPQMLCEFVEKTLTESLERPTISVIEAAKWRNDWGQLTNPRLTKEMDVLAFGTKHNVDRRVYQRNTPCLSKLLGIVRLRTGDEAPQYITNQETWKNDQIAVFSRDLFELSGYIDQTTQNVFHYFSIGRLPDTVKGPQKIKGRKDPYKIEDGGGFSFKHQQMVEMVPFFVCDDLQNESGLKTLCRVPHYLRSSPAWAMGNIALPYPMHLGEKLIEDQLCILGFES